MDQNFHVHEPILCWPEDALARVQRARAALPRDLIAQTILGVSKALVMLDDEAKALPEGAERKWVEVAKRNAIDRLRELHIQHEATPK